MCDVRLLGNLDHFAYARAGSGSSVAAASTAGVRLLWTQAVEGPAGQGDRVPRLRALDVRRPLWRVICVWRTNILYSVPVPVRYSVP